MGYMGDGRCTRCACGGSRWLVAIAVAVTNSAVWCVLNVKPDYVMCHDDVCCCMLYLGITYNV
jgi:hypothetical protein